MKAVMAFWEHLAAMLPRSPVYSRRCPKRGEKPGKLPGLMRTNSQFSEEKEKKDSSKLNEQRGNVYENKGLA